jgi:hypothetical protein
MAGKRGQVGSDPWPRRTDIVVPYSFLTAYVGQACQEGFPRKWMSIAAMLFIRSPGARGCASAMPLELRALGRGYSSAQAIKTQYRSGHRTSGCGLRSDSIRIGSAVSFEPSTSSHPAGAVRVLANDRQYRGGRRDARPRASLCIVSTPPCRSPRTHVPFMLNEFRPALTDGPPGAGFSSL